MNICKWTFWGAFALACSSLALGGNIVTNGGFETGDLTGWTSNPGTDDAWFVTDGSTFEVGAPNSGSFFVQNGCEADVAACITADPDEEGNWLYQDLATTPATLYNLSFFYFPGNIDGDLTPVELQVLWGDSATPLVASTPGTCDMVNSNCVFDNTDSGTYDYTEYTVSNLLATSSSMRLEFLGMETPDWDGVDDISVQASTVPEPAAFLLMGTGLLGLGVFRRRRRK